MQYYQATNPGKGFITHEDNERSHIAGYPGEIWSTESNTEWATRVGAVSKTKEEAQAIVDAITATAQANWDSLPEEQKANSQRPVNIVLE